MSDADPLPPLRDIIRDYELRAKKSFGQNFLLDLNLTRKIARHADENLKGTTLEVGPGPGGLTRALLMEGAEHVFAIEMDMRCKPVLDMISANYPHQLSYKIGDALIQDEEELLSIHPKPYRVVANLPYNVGTAMLIKWLKVEWQPWWQSLTLMFQKEVAERIVARPGNKAYGRLAILSQWRSKTRLMFEVPKQAFTPPPKVTSAIVRITPCEPLIPDLKVQYLEAITQAAFGKRRKMLRASLKGIGVNEAELLEKAGIEPTLRAENLDVMDFCRLAKLYQDMTS